MVDALEKARDILDAEHSSAFFDGVDEGILRMAKAMRQDGDSPEKIVRITGLPLEKVNLL